MAYRIIIFLIINFLALAIGGYFTGKAVNADWYLNMNKAPWTPPGWVFGAAWTTIMILFALYINGIWETSENKASIILLFAIQWILNVAWNPVFFYYQSVWVGLMVIVALTLLIAFFAINFWTQAKLNTLFILPYLVWLLIATSLNAYICLKN